MKFILEHIDFKENIRMDRQEKQCTTTGQIYCMNKIIVNLGNFKLDEIPLHRGTLNIGRAPDNDISLADPATSSRHAKIVTIFASSFIQDLNSTNGTIVNGRKIVRHTLHNGDVVSIGNLHLMFQTDSNNVAETAKKTIMIDKHKLKSLMKDQETPASKRGYKKKKNKKNRRQEKSPKAGTERNDITPLSVKKPEDASIPTLEEALPLSELRNNLSMPVSQPPLEADATLPDEDTLLEDEEIVLETISHLDDTLSLVEPGSEPEPDEEEIKAMLLGDNVDGRATVLFKYAIAISVVALTVLLLYIFL